MSYNVVRISVAAYYSVGRLPKPQQEQDNCSKGRRKNCNVVERIQGKGVEVGSGKKNEEFVAKEVRD